MTKRTQRSSHNLWAEWICKPLWQIQTTDLGMVLTTLTIQWNISRFWIHPFYPSCIQATLLQQTQFLWWLFQTWPKEKRVLYGKHKRRGILVGIGIGLRIAGQLQWDTSKERHSLEKVSLSNMEHGVAILF